MIGVLFDEVIGMSLCDALDVIGGLAKGELRAKAAMRLGVDTVSGMALLDGVVQIIGVVF